MPQHALLDDALMFMREAQMLSSASHGDLEQPADQRRPYSCPKLTAFGSVRQLTRGGGGSSCDANAMISMDQGAPCR